MRSLLLAALFLAGTRAHAGFALDLNVFYLSDSMTYATAPSVYGRTMWEVAPLISLDKKGTYMVGWNYGSMGFTDNPAGVPTTLTITDMGPKFVYTINKARTLVFGFDYNLISTGKYASGAATSELRGTSMKAELAYTPELSETIYLGFKINYYRATFAEEIVTTTLTKTTNSRTAIYPSFAMMFRWD